MSVRFSVLPSVTLLIMTVSVHFSTMVRWIQMIFSMQMYDEEMQVKLLPLDLENFLKTTVSVHFLSDSRTDSKDVWYTDVSWTYGGQVRIWMRPDLIIIGEVIDLGLRKLLENDSFCSFSKWWFDGFKLYLVYRCIMKGCRFFNLNFLRGGGVAFSYIFNFLRIAETILMNRGRNEVLMIAYKCCCISNYLHKDLMTGVLCTVCGTLVQLLLHDLTTYPQWIGDVRRSLFKSLNNFLNVWSLPWWGL
jgi:hypothetical protein